MRVQTAPDAGAVRGFAELLAETAGLNPAFAENGSC